VTGRTTRPDDGLFGPDSVTWRMHLEPVLWVGGFRALLLQSLHPRVIRGTYQNTALFDPRRARLHALPDLVGRPRRHRTRRKTEDDKRRNQSRRRALFAAIRQDAAAGLSRRTLEREHHVGRRTIVKALASETPPPQEDQPPPSCPP